jgi:hypothetical protein
MRFATKRERLGELWGDGQLREGVQEFLKRSTDKLEFVYVGDAEGATSGNGHGYFRSSPWVSSDVLMNLRYGLSGEERGLVREPDTGLLRFPPDYTDKLRSALNDQGIALAEN